MCSPPQAFVAIGDHQGHIGLGSKASKEVANAIKGAIQDAKLNIVPVRMGYWGSKMGMPHTVPCKLTGKCGSSRIKLIPAPRGTGIVAAPTSKKILTMAGVSDCFTQASGATATQGNFAKAAFMAISRSYTYLTPDLWTQETLSKPPAQEHTDYLARTAKA